MFSLIGGKYRIIFMELKKYLESNYITKRGFAKKLGVTESTLYNIISGRAYPAAKVAQKIVELTNGEVTFEELFKKR